MSNKFQKSILERLENEAITLKYNNNETDYKNDIKEYLKKDNTRNAKNKTFYLDVEVIESIKKNAKLNDVTDSKLVNDILKKILI